MDDAGQQEQRSADQDAAIEAAFVAGTLPEEDRRAPEAPAAEVPAKRRVTVVATRRGFDGAAIVEEGQRLTLELTEQESIPEWTDLVPESES